MRQTHAISLIAKSRNIYELVPMQTNHAEKPSKEEC